MRPDLRTELNMTRRLLQLGTVAAALLLITGCSSPSQIDPDLVQDHVALALLGPIDAEPEAIFRFGAGDALGEQVFVQYVVYGWTEEIDDLRFPTASRWAMLGYGSPFRSAGVGNERLSFGRRPHREPLLHQKAQYPAARPDEHSLKVLRCRRRHLAKAEMACCGITDVKAVKHERMGMDV